VEGSAVLMGSRVEWLLVFEVVGLKVLREAELAEVV
jgi:hypothetical protein